MENITKTLYCDVAIIGGGTGGCAAAIECARLGLHTILFERNVTLGGLATNGYVPQIAGGIEGLSLEFAKRLDSMGQLRKPDPSKDYYRNPSFEPEYGKLVLEDMVFEAGSRIIYDATFIDTVVEDGVIKAAVFYTKGGYMEVKARAYIDATGDADVAAMSGVPYEVGGQDFAGLNQGTSQGSRWANANLKKYKEAEEEYKRKEREKGNEPFYPLIYVLEEEAIQRGELARHICTKRSGFYRVIIPNTTEENAEFVTFSFQSYYCHNTDVEDLTRQIIEQHQLIKNFHKFLRNHVPGFENVRLVGLGSIPGVRDSRRIFGEYMLKASDVGSGAKFEDGIARFPERFDTHHPTNQWWYTIRHIHMKEATGSALLEDEHIGIDCDARMHPFGVPEGYPARVNPQDYCEIPYRCLVPQKIDNLLCVGRCCSAEFHANGAMRIIAPAMGTGQAAGVAAWMALNEQKKFREIDGRNVRKKLIEEGVNLDEPCDGYWKEIREKEPNFAIDRGDEIVFVDKK